MQTSLQTTANTWTAGRFWTYTEVEHAQGLDITSMYPINTGSSGLWVRGKRAWSGGGEKGKPILGFLFRLFWGKCPARMTYHLKEARMSWDH